MECWLTCLCHSDLVIAQVSCSDRSGAFDKIFFFPVWQGMRKVSCSLHQFHVYLEVILSNMYSAQLAYKDVMWAVVRLGYITILLYQQDLLL